VNPTNRWSSRLKDRLELRVSSRREPRLLGVVGGAAQLNVMITKRSSTMVSLVPKKGTYLESTLSSKSHRTQVVMSETSSRAHQMIRKKKRWATLYVRRWWHGRSSPELDARRSGWFRVAEVADGSLLATVSLFSGVVLGACAGGRRVPAAPSRE
jgi:hypothetical protein